MNVINKACRILDLLYKHGWDERNGGNLSFILTLEEVREIIKEEKELRTYTYSLDLTPLIGKYFFITGTGKYFKNCLDYPEENVGIFKVKDSHTLSLLWGLKDNGGPTSETPMHMMVHIERLKIDPNHRVVMHCHPDNIIAMSHIHDSNENEWTKDLWKMQTESIVVFPEGVGVLPWMVCGDYNIAKATADKMKEYRSVIWSQHGLVCTGKDLDEAYGLIETIEKAAIIYMLTYGKEIKNTITDENLLELAKAFNINFKKGIID